ncbi:MAG TPA: HIT domain-containing protein [Acidobacteriota bacterium]|nr:HIT domain-containing protein [Acidobacteriota bacterium]
MVEDSIFTKIINKEIPARIVYEDKLFIAVLDVNPNTKGHTILIPKYQCESVSELPSKFLENLMPTAVEIAKLLQKKIYCKAFNFEINDGEFAGQEIPHVHLHIIPRYNKKERIITRKNHNDNLDKVLSLIKG